MYMDIQSELSAIFPPDRIKFNTTDLELYGTCTLPENRRGQFVVFPINEIEVSKTVLLAQKKKFPIYYFSTGKNWGYGSSQPVVENSIIMILDKMNKICEFNEELGYVVIEPGVTQKQLFDFLQKQNTKYWMDCTDSTPHASVLGNALERGVGYTHYGDHFGNLCGLEVVLADGSVIKTDSLSGEPSRTFRTYKWGTGPYLEGLFTQSNLGIVIRSGLWLMPAPACHEYYIVELEQPERLDFFVDGIRKLALDRIISNAHIFNPYMVSFGYEKFPQEIPAEKNLTSDYLQKLYKKWSIRPWTALGAIYGTKGQVSASRKEIKAKFKKGFKIHFLKESDLGMLKKIRPYSKNKFVYGVFNFFSKLFLSKDFDQISFLPELFTFQRGEPGEFLISKAYYKNYKSTKKENFNPAHDGCGLFWLAPILPASGSEIKEFLEFLNVEHEKFASTPSLSLIQVNPRTMIVAIFIVFNKESKLDTEKATKLYLHLAEAVQKRRYQHYRTSVLYMDKIIEAGLGSHTVGLKLKKVLDENNVLAPGRYGTS
jgi:4-cresol dehydrogenase (hydroxylating) flavoprotein subunit